VHDIVIRSGTIVDGTGAPRHTGDVAIDGGVLTQVGGKVDGAGRRELDGDGLVVAPGWVDIHTHYDGQVTWDPELTPSSWHGVTTVVMGNCGVGFAPVRPGDEAFLIELMEGVEDIPGSALHEGIDWQWESFDEYLDSLDRTHRVLDVAAQVPHAAVRAYVMGERAHEDATAGEVLAMADLVEAGLRAGAIGFTTSRTSLHRSKHGFVPGTFAPAHELLAIGDAMGRVGRRAFEVVTDHLGSAPEVEMLVELARRSGAMVTYALAQSPFDADMHRRALDDATRYVADGVSIVPQVSSRPTGLLFGLQSSLHPFMTHPTYLELRDLPLEERVARLRDTEVRAKLVSESPATGNHFAAGLMTRFGQIFPMGEPRDYEPARSASVAAVAERDGRDPREVALDWLLERDGKALLFAPLVSYGDYNHDAIREMITHPASVLGLSDGGAHCGLICDASMPTTLLTHWVRDRWRGERIELEHAVRLQTSRTAEIYGFADRGTLAPGLRADVNLIDLDGLTVHEPEMVFDLPAGGRRLVQHVDGYEATICAGEVTFVGAEPTGARPGRLVRAGRRVAEAR
jgi:N-acyl-D-amino-acid deacylase